MRIDTIQLTDEESARLRAEFMRIAHLPHSKLLRDLPRAKLSSPEGHALVQTALDYGYAALRALLEPAHLARLEAYARDPGNDLLVLENLPERPELDDPARSMVNPDLGLSMADLMSYAYARLLGTRLLPSFKIDQVTKSYDDNLHQDGMHRGVGISMLDYKPADYIALQCIRPGHGGHAGTLYSDLDALMEELPPDIAEAIALPRFLPQGSRTRYPLVVQEDGHWRLHEQFTLQNPFSAGLLAARALRSDTEGRHALHYLCDYKPDLAARMYETDWKPGMHVLARQERLFHRRRTIGDEVEGRLLNRVRLFTDGPPAVAPEASLDALREKLLQGLDAMRDAGPEIEEYRQKWKAMSSPSREPSLAFA